MTMLKHRTLSGALLDELRQAILSGGYPGGSQLRQDALAEAYGVSRIPIREVLLQLEAEGLVRIVPRKGAVVSELSRLEVDDVFGLRAVLEPRLLSASAPLLTEEDLAAAEAIHARFKAVAAERRVDRFGELNAELHRKLYSRAEMPRTQQIVASLLQTSDRYTRLQLSSAAAMERAMAEHESLIRLCRHRAFGAAAAFLIDHIEAVHDDLVAVLTPRG